MFIQMESQYNVISFYSRMTIDCDCKELIIQILQYYISIYVKNKSF